MIDQNPEGSAPVLFTLPPKTTFRPVGNNILLQYDKPEKAGAIHLPMQQKPLDTIVAPVLAVGPDCKVIKPGDHILLLTKALIGGVEGLSVYGTRLYMTQEPVVIAVVG